MLALAAAPLQIPIVALDADPLCPASRVAEVITGPLGDRASLYRLADSSDVLTFEIEHTNPPILAELEAAGHTVRPSAGVLSLIADKLHQKRFFESCDLPVAPLIAEDASTLRGSLPESIPKAVQKARRGGYDGRGVAVVSGGASLPLPGPSFVERAIDITTEIAVIVTRFPDGSLHHWEPVEMGFDSRLHLVRHVVSPAAVSEGVAREAVAIGRAAAAALGDRGLVGVLAVELFVDSGGRVILNEVAPRPHNSGHLTIEGSGCSQFEQHVRAVAGLPPGDTTMSGPVAMVNLVAEDTATAGPYRIEGRERALTHRDVHLHLYGKRDLRRGRKMGHVTARAATTEEALAKAVEAARAIRFVPCTPAERRTADGGA